MPRYEQRSFSSHINTIKNVLIVENWAENMSEKLLFKINRNTFNVLKDEYSLLNSD